jgi:hypothetical protein
MCEESLWFQSSGQLSHGAAAVVVAICALRGLVAPSAGAAGASSAKESE